MKPKTLWSALAPAVGVLALGTFHLAACGSYSDRGAGDPFVGTWSCPTSFPASAQTITITEALDNSLVFSEETGDAGSSVCPSDQWSYSGTTVAMTPGTLCLGGAGGTQIITVNSFRMTATGSTLAIAANETFSGPGTAKQTVSFTGACKKQ